MNTRPTSFSRFCYYCSTRYHGMGYDFARKYKQHFIFNVKTKHPLNFRAGSLCQVYRLLLV